MGCMTSVQEISAHTHMEQQKSLSSATKGETVLAALSRLDDEIAKSERSHPAARLAVVAAELESIQLEIKTFEEHTTGVSKDSYAKTIHQLFVSLDLYRRPMLSSENEDFVANVNRKEMRRLELSWLRTRYTELVRERRVLHAQILRIRSLYAQLQHLLETVWGVNGRPDSQQEGALAKALGLRDALASVSARLRAAAEYVHAAVRLLDDAMPAWKLTTIGKSGWERTAACADAAALLVAARCAERGARRVLAAPAAPRAARALRLALDYAFTDAMHDHKYQRATEVFFQFKDALVLLIDSIHQELRKEMFKALSTKLKCQNIYHNVRRRHSKVSMVLIYINGTPVQVPSYFTIMQALRREKVTIPSFCYHDRLSIAGNCRMCLVEIEGMLKPQVACALGVSKNMRIRTNSETTSKAQESVLEFILVDHPLDCPICDQGGECDLQDLSVRFGNDRSRFTDIHFAGKRAVENKILSPLIRAEMNRCIHCTRCIRFGAQICGVEVLGSTGRGHNMLVGTFVEKPFFSELSGNIVDLCPVGALTSIPYKFKARSWELKKASSIDVTDATGTNIILNYRFDRVLRVLPRENVEVNQEWVSDKGRWAIDSLEMQRLVTPMKRAGSCCCPLEWDCALKTASEMIRCVAPASIMAIAGPHTNVETLVTCKDFLNTLGCENTFVERDFCYSGSDTDIRAGYSLNVNMKDIAQADKILLVGTNPRFEAPILNAWIRQAYLFNDADIYAIGPQCDYNYHVEYIGNNVSALAKATELLKTAKKPLIFVGIAQLESALGGKIMSVLHKFTSSFKPVSKDWGIINVITKEASFAGALEAGWKPGALHLLNKNPPKVIISLGADEIFYQWNPPTSCKIIYIGFQGDRGSEFANIILPGCAYTESGGMYLNMECRSQFALPAVTPPGKARHDWKIVRALAQYCLINLYYCDHNSLCTRLVQISPNFMYLGNYQPKLFSDLVGQLVNPGAGGSASDALTVEMRKIQDYYCSDVYTNLSPTMIKTKKAATKFESSPYYCV